MIDTLKKETWAKVILVLFVLFFAWWLYLRTLDAFDIQHQVFSALYGTVALAGGVFGILASRKWGGYKSLFGRAILMFSLGLFLQEFGQLAYSFYVFFLHIEIPYPSIGDIGYFGSIPCYVYGTWLLSMASGAKLKTGQFHRLVLASVIPFVLLVGAYMLFLRGYTFEWSSPLTIFLDFGYPLGGAIYLSIAILTYFFSFKVLGGVMKDRVLMVLFALLVQFFADYTFLYLARYDTVLPGGVNDLLYLVAYFIMGLALVQIKHSFDSLNRGEK